jgi:HAD superfamily hydrolase (TIGR01509 family)
LQTLVPHWTKEDNKRQRGLSLQDTYTLLVKEYDLDHEFDAFKKTFEEFVHDLYASTKLIDGIEDVFQRLEAMKIPIGLSTATREEWLLPVLDRHNIRHYFKAISCEDHVPQSKPHPDVYLRTAKLLGISPTHCIALEDSLQGLTSAKAAGMYCIGFQGPEHLHREEDLSTADMLIAHPNELTEEVLRKL